MFVPHMIEGRGAGAPYVPSAEHEFGQQVQSSATSGPVACDQRV